MRKRDDVRLSVIRPQDLPIDAHVKSAHSTNLLSLARYKEKFGDRVADGIVLHHGDVTRKRHINYLPYYMATVL